MADLGQEEIKRVLDYCPDTGVMRWKVSRGKAKAGEIAGSINANGYVVIGYKGSVIAAHRLAFLWMLGVLPEADVDHINHDRADNCWSNLRVTTRSENLQNMRLHPKNRSGIMGVGWCKSSDAFLARIGVAGKDITLLRTKDFFEACAARKSAELKHGFHANHGLGG